MIYRKLYQENCTEDNLSSVHCLTYNSGILTVNTIYNNRHRHVKKLAKTINAKKGYNNV